MVSLPLLTLAAPRPPLPPAPERGSLRRFGFDESNTWTRLRPAPVVCQDIQLHESWSGYALGASARPPSLLRYRAAEFEEGRFRFNLHPTAGAVRLWVCPDWSSAALGGSGPGDWARLIETSGRAGDAEGGLGAGWLARWRPSVLPQSGGRQSRRESPGVHRLEGRHLGLGGVELRAK